MGTDENDYSIFLAGDNAGFERLVIRYKDGLIYYLNNIIKNIRKTDSTDSFIFHECSYEIAIYPTTRIINDLFDF